MTNHIRPGCSAAFERDLDGEQTVAYVAELRELIKEKDVLREITEESRRAIVDLFQVSFVDDADGLMMTISS